MNKIKRVRLWIMIMVIATLVLGGCSEEISNAKKQDSTEIVTTTVKEKITKNNQSKSKDTAEKTSIKETTKKETEKKIKTIKIQKVKSKMTNMKVHFIDVGQGDSTLIESNGHFMLIDAGNNNKGQTVVNYLKSQGVKTLDYVIGTHPDADHVGGLDNVLYSFKVKKVFLPNKTHTTITYMDVLTSIKSSGLKITLPKVGKTYELGNAKFQIIAPNSSSYNDMNGYSIGIKLTNFNNSFILCGDAPIESEDEMIYGHINLKADVLKLSHHGSKTSNSEEFIKAVNPKFAVISCGLGNSYGHPNQVIMDRLKNHGIKIFRTDYQNTIVCTSTGKKLKWSTKKSNNYKGGDSGRINKANSSSSNSSKKIVAAANNNKGSSSSIVYTTNSGTKYHRAGCRYLSKSCIKINLSEAISRGLEPCKVCSPPTK